MSKEEKKFQCNILSYLESRHPKAYKAITELCLGGNLKPRKDSGVTFIVPHDKVLSELMPKVYSDKESDIEEAINIMKAHILNDCYDVVGEFKDNEVSNRLGQKLEFDSISGNTAILKNKTALNYDSGFKVMPKRTGMAVYIASGPMPTDGPAASQMRERKPRGERKPRAEGGAEFGQGERTKLATEIVNKPDGQFILTVVLSILKHLEGKPSYNRACASLDMSPYVSFYLLVEPYKTEGKYLVDSADLDGWNVPTASSAQGEAAIGEYMKYIKHAASLLSGDLKHVDEIVDNARWSILSSGIAKTSVLTGISRAYSAAPKLFKEDELNSFFFSDRYKEWQDEIRFHINYLITYWETDLLTHKHEFREVDSTINAMMCCTKPSFDKLAESPLPVSQAQFMSGPIAFVESGSFLHYPMVETTATGSAEERQFDSYVYEVSGAGTGKMKTLRNCAACL